MSAPVNPLQLFPPAWSALATPICRQMHRPSRIDAVRDAVRVEELVFPEYSLAVIRYIAAFRRAARTGK